DAPRSGGTAAAPALAGAATLVDRLRRRGTTISHFVGHLTYGDAVSFDAVNKWRAPRAPRPPGRRRCGLPAAPDPQSARPLSQHRPSPRELIVFHYAVWSETAAYVLSLRQSPMLFVYHNVTPTKWFQGVHRQAEEDTRLGRERLPSFAERA